jgi:uncharacterized protein (TIGR02246 family)
MSRRTCALSAGLLALAVGAVTLSLVRLPAREPDSPGKAPAKEAPKGPAKEADALADLRKSSGQFVQAFNRGDAKALAQLWAPDGEYTGPDGSKLKGRAAIEKAYADLFKESPKAKLEGHIEALRLLGRNTALQEGTLRLTRPGSDHPEGTRYSALLVRQEGKWLAAVVREFDLEPAERVSLDDVGWLVGEWVAKSGTTEVRAKYEWDKNKAFILGKLEMTEKGKTITSLTQRIGKDGAAGQLRSWVFESGGGFGHWLWARDGKRWVIEAEGSLPDGTQTSAVNLLIPNGPDAFTFQSVERTLGDVELADLAPVKVTRVKK